jgi:hypothetical protein
LSNKRVEPPSEAMSPGDGRNITRPDTSGEAGAEDSLETDEARRSM